MVPVKSMWHRPNIALELARCCSTFKRLQLELGDAMPINFASLSIKLSKDLDQNPAPFIKMITEQADAYASSFVVKSLITTLNIASSEYITSAQADFKKLTNTTTNKVLNQDEQLLALQKLGLSINSISPTDLAPHRRRLAVKALERLQRLQEIEAYIKKDLPPILRLAYISTPLTEISSADSQLRTLMVDTPLLYESLCKFEAGRHIKLIFHQATRLASSYQDYTPEELFSWGYKGLLTAIRAYDPTKWAFSTYACTRIVGTMQDGIRQESPVPKRLNTYMRNANLVSSELTQKLSRTPSSSELSSALAAERLQRELRRAPSVSELSNAASAELKSLKVIRNAKPPVPAIETADPGEQQYSENRNGGAGNIIASNNTVDETILKLTLSAMHDAIQDLPFEEAQAIQLLDIDGLTLLQASQVTGASTRQLRSRRTRARGYLTEALATWA